MKETLIKNYKTTIPGLVALVVYFLLYKGYIKPPFDEVLKENLTLILVSIPPLILAFYAKDPKDKEEK